MELTPQSEAKCITRRFILRDLVRTRLSDSTREQRGGSPSQDAFREGGPAFLSSLEIGVLFCGFVLVAFLHSGIYSIRVEGPAWRRPTVGLRSGWAL